jgi:hypothetical protein
VLRDPIFCSISSPMGEKRDDQEQPFRELRHGLTHSWNAALGAAINLREVATRTDVGKAFEYAGRELARAATNVVEQLTDETSEIARDAMPCETTDQATTSDHPGVSPASTLEDTDTGARTGDTGPSSAPGTAPMAGEQRRSARVGFDIGPSRPAPGSHEAWRAANANQEQKLG